MDQYFARMCSLMLSKELPARIRFLLQVITVFFRCVGKLTVFRSIEIIFLLRTFCIKGYRRVARTPLGSSQSFS